MSNVQYFLFFPLLIVFLFFHLESCDEKKRHKGGLKNDPHITKIYRGIEVDSIEANIRSLRNYHTQDDIDAVRHWIYDTFKRYEEASDHNLKVSYTYRSEEEDSAEIVNIAAILPGTQLESKERMYVVSGLYDAAQSDNKNDIRHIPNMGVIMELVRTMSEHEFDATLVFLISVDRKKNRTGTAHFIKGIQKYNLHIAGLVLNDLASYKHRANKYKNEVRISVPRISGGENQNTNNDLQSRELGQYFYEMSEQFVPHISVEVVEREDTERELFADFNEYPVVRLDPPGQEDREREEVPPANAARYVDYNYLHQVVKLNAAVLSTLANAPAGPSEVRADIAQSDDNISLQWEPNNEPDLKGYEVVWRAMDEPYWTDSEFVGDTTAFTLKGVSTEDLFFGVRAVDRYDHKSPAAFPMSIQD
ncbi:hypothetical protein LQ318_02570 [Aliifodinibius salicampi]|uniref:Fibronectin type-III domain-containing protein n=1 Tax=Fodinibius salicampi TaxID=1920655 RepID=A0ABT3PV87_9BACT|nr:hypothetical protein [Fodinibius salicampi]MCW9711777.1 hypothetical protein [Fodinibius salicampi]